MKFPENYLYTIEHEWLNQQGDIFYVGITDFAQNELGDIVFLEIETIGQTLEQGKIFGTIEAVKTVSDLFIPVSGKILEVNKNIMNKPELVNQDPYGEGWLVKIQISHPDELLKLLKASDYKALIGK